MTRSVHTSSLPCCSCVTSTVRGRQLLLCPRARSLSLAMPNIGALGLIRLSLLDGASTGAALRCVGCDRSKTRVVRGDQPTRSGCSFGGCRRTSSFVRVSDWCLSMWDPATCCARRGDGSSHPLSARRRAAAACGWLAVDETTAIQELIKVILEHKAEAPPTAEAEDGTAAGRAPPAPAPAGLPDDIPNWIKLQVCILLQLVGSHRGSNRWLAGVQGVLNL